MIIDGPNTIDLAVGTDRRIPQAGDSQLELPPLLMPVLLNLKPHSPSPTVTNALFEGSAILRDVQTSNPPSSAAAAANLMLLDQGVWELELTMSAWFDYGGTAPAVVGAQLRISYQSVVINLLLRFASVGSFIDYNRVRLLLLSPAQLSQVAGATGVAQNNSVLCTINAIKVL